MTWRHLIRAVRMAQGEPTQVRRVSALYFWLRWYFAAYVGAPKPRWAWYTGRRNARIQRINRLVERLAGRAQ